MLQIKKNSRFTPHRRHTPVLFRTRLDFACFCFTIRRKKFQKLTKYTFLTWGIKVSFIHIFLPVSDWFVVVSKYIERHVFLIYNRTGLTVLYTTLAETTFLLFCRSFFLLSTMPSAKKKWKRGFDKRNRDIDDLRGKQTKCIVKLIDTLTVIRCGVSVSTELANEL